MYFDPKKTLTY